MPADGMGRLNCEMAPRLKTTPAEVKVPIKSQTSVAAPRSASKVASKCSVCKGLFPVMLYSLLFLAFPLADYYMDIDYVETEARAGVIVASFLAALVVLVANDCVAWFNMALLFHVGVEVTVLDTLVNYAQASTTEDTATALAWVASSVIFLHLLPFFLLDHPGVLTLLAFAGVVVNASALVFVQPQMLLLVGFSSVILLGLVLLIACIDCVKTSMLSQLKQAVAEGTWILCTKYEI